jgi:hypothetical protein
MVSSAASCHWPFSTKMRSNPCRAAERTTQPITAAIVA